MFDKKPTTVKAQIELLRQRGLIITDIDNAEMTLSNISYYRLAGYWWPMQSDKENHTFKPGSLFCDVIALYKFDQELRVIIFEAIEKIEISLRTKLVYHLSHEFDPWWFQNSSLFQNTKELIRTLSNLDEELERSKDVFIKEHRKKHKDDLRFPPAWKSLELTSFGTLSKLYGNLNNDIQSKDKIAIELGTVNHTYLPSWLQCISQLRNYCAHHSRLWNRNLPGKPKLMSKPPFLWLNNVPDQNEYHNIYIHLCLIQYLLSRVNTENKFSENLKNLINRYSSNVDPIALGLKQNWQQEVLWK